MPRGAFIVNRFRLPPPSADAPPTERDAAEAVAARGLTLDADAPSRLVHAHADAVRLAALDALHVRGLYERAKARVPVIRIPELPSDVHDLETLGLLSDMLMNGGV